MAWNQPGGAEPPKSRRQGKAAGPFDAFLSRWAQRLGGNGGDGAGQFGMLPRLVAALLVVVWLGSGLYQIDAAERGVIQRFGKFQTITATGVGMGWHLPWPIETLSKVDVSGINSIEYQSRVLTSDVNLVNITCAIQYQNADALKVLYQVRDPEATLREVSESAIREVIGQNPLDAVLAGGSRAAITSATRDRIQKTLEGYQSGVRVISVNLTEVQVPEAVQAAQRDANKAIEDRERYAKEAQAYAQDIVPRAKGAAQRQLLDAEAYKLQVVARATGDAARFEQLIGAYTAAPEVTRNRMYIDTMNTILARSRKVIVDVPAGKGGNNVLYLPLDKLVEGSARPVGGVTPEISVGAATPAAPAQPTPAQTGDNDTRGRDRVDR
jgi:membrane protease subunit HflK